MLELLKPQTAQPFDVIADGDREGFLTHQCTHFLPTVAVKSWGGNLVALDLAPASERGPRRVNASAGGRLTR